MGTDNYSLGREQFCFVVNESTFGAAPGSTSADAFAAADAIRVITADANSAFEHEPQSDHDNSRTVSNRNRTRETGTFAIEGFFLGAGTASGTPDADIVFANAFGSGAASTTTYLYRLTTDRSASFSMLLDNQTNRNHTKMALGCVVNTLTLSAENDGQVRFRVEGDCARVVDTGRAEMSGAASAGDTDILLVDSSGIMSNSIISVLSQAGEQLRVTANNLTTNTITVDRGWGTTASAAIASGDLFLAWSPASQTLASTNPVAGTKGSVTITNGVASNIVKSRSWEFTLNNNHEFVNDSYGAERAECYVNAQKRETLISADFRLERDLIPLIIGAGKNFAAQNVAIVIGDTAGNQWTLTMPSGEANMPDITYPERDVADVTMEWMGVSATDNAEVTLDQT